ncbi:bifunctional hydroxymethylpyrimidine kinase/phosphomethylpyrimidine kinase [Candidatus Micrarchaeota archaeon]|nr:bifunctional hydroxymethylpyrimidine kinase/phosphomethylpyrimidine kinase [Candidatus Micrarchaeota archaeon]MBU1886432.1 bifunctional hydroxymethylpyrimidine kinase/phosphomethylpyrimidine kinase [Candidatus Micrarchaeota archaeon]
MIESKEANILVIGDVMVDRYTYGAVERISPEAPVPVLLQENDELFLGGAGLVAHTLKNLGANVDFISVVGADKTAGTISDLLKQSKISDTLLISDSERKTTIKHRFVATSPYFQMLLRADKETHSNISAGTEAKAINTIKKMVPSSDIIIISDYNKGLMTGNVIGAVIETAKQHGKKVIVDTKKSIYDYKGVYLVAPNTRELCLAFGLKNTNDDGLVLQSATKLSKALGAIAVIKRGSKGATIANDSSLVTYPSVAKKVLNVSGAGDIFVSIMAWALASGHTVDDAVKLANKGCGIAISKRHPSIELSEII